ncbi:glutamine--fructose-6-phosphate transaminase (isomerizing) [Candidatus Roizmanbacteria bacterium]|nr:glutamine--fructose-6-phosphate transaminase (isomerizing) [Candidatus Roizmanbacteria bacterium]
MCGIFGIVNDGTSQAAQTVLDGLKKLEYRGYDSWGIAIIPKSGGRIRIEKHVGKIGSAKTTLPDSTIAIGHTRWATHGGVTDINAHPHLDCSGQIAVIHNGIVENYQDLKEELKREKHTFHSETDTEVIAHAIEEELKTGRSINHAVFSVFNTLVGSNAIGVLDLHAGSIVICRNGSPLAIGIGSNSYYLGSDVTAFLKFTRRVYFLADGEAAVLTVNGVKLYDISSQAEKKLVTHTVDWKVEDVQKGGYPHFLLKEIIEQTATIKKTARLNETELKQIAKKIADGGRVVLCGCGTAFYCALAAKYYFSLAGIEAQAYGAYEFLPFAKFADKKTLFIAISQSGETADTLIAAKAAKKNGAHLIAVVNARASTLERLSDTIIAVGAGPEIAVVSTKAFTAQLATLYLLSRAVGGKYKEAQKAMTNLGAVLEKWLTPKNRTAILNLAKKLIDYEDMYLIGKHLNFPAAMEFALKIKETSYIHAEAFASGELKHGVITLIQKGTPCFALFANDETRQEVLSSATELKARGATIIGISPFAAPEFNYHIQTPELGDLTIFGNIIVGQLLGYYLGIGRGTDPDKPRNLAKSVTVK